MAAAAPAVIPSPSVLDSLSSNVNLVGGLWFVSSALLTTYSTTSFLKYQHADSDSCKIHVPNRLHLPRPQLLTLFRFGGSLLLGLLLHPDVHLISRIRATMATIPDFVLPAAFLTIANYANSIALNRIGISLTYTSKCAIPIFTVLLTYLLDGPTALPALPTLLSLVPIAGGIALASWDSPVFEAKGFSFAMISSSAQTALNVCSKKALAKTGLSGAEGQRAMVAVGLAITAVLFLLQKQPEHCVDDEIPPPSWLSLLAVTAYHLEYVLSFTFVRMVAPVAYGASDAVRRLAIIISGHYMFGHDRFTTVNVLGIATALVGAMAYAITSHAF
ncbi:Phosphoenolpyruvate/phosphate translocator 2, chloroplastic [Seminavis robusta]|uniref:Phosphoenolpyruvate/phosphate translocator 2, chloroplastic n=1 Tax=Seminavis robusta TaxID=568900 RepID=A0A9N8DB75_9STRA|nr:Phosphoenolpyruvate/phosphate translocator 2, chloroplastic [Seminavis robusta]|eukprot:Sro62_g035460.1 Phosphoenolpyruvate/phosphate translocator 2, chloroplastic (331) ;mRNA; f:97307-98411